MAPKNELKSKKKGIKNKSDFKSKLEGRPSRKKGRNVAWESPWRTPIGAPGESKKTIGPKTHVPKTKNQITKS